MVDPESVPATNIVDPEKSHCVPLHATIMLTTCPPVFVKAMLVPPPVGSVAGFENLVPKPEGDHG